MGCITLSSHEKYVFGHRFTSKKIKMSGHVSFVLEDVYRHPHFQQCKSQAVHSPIEVTSREPDSQAGEGILSNKVH